MRTLRQVLLTFAIGGPLLALGCASPLEVTSHDTGAFGVASASTEGVAVRVPTGAALGVAVSGNIAYVSEPFNNTVASLDLTTNTITGRVAVGSLPCFVVFNSTGTKAYVANQFSDNVSVIDVATGTQTALIPVTGDPLPVAISGDDKTLFVTTNANRLFKINLATNTVVGSLPLPATSHHLLVHPSKPFIYVATRDAGSVLEVNWKAMEVERTFTLGGRAQGMAMSADRKELYVADELGNVLRVVNLQSGATVATVPLESGGEGLALSADGARLYVGLVFAGKVQVLDRAARTTINVINTGGTPREIATDPTRKRTLVANEAGWVDIIDTLPPPPPPPDSGLIARISAPGGPLGIAVSSQRVGYVGQINTNAVARFDLTTNTVTSTIGVGSLPCFIVFNAAGTTAYVANLGSDNVSIIDVASGTQTDVIPVTGDPLPVAISGDGTTLFVTTNVNKLFKIDIATKAVLGSIDLPATSHHLLMHPNDNLLYVATRDAGSVLEVDWRSMTVVRTFTLGGRTQGMAISPDQTELYVADEIGNALQVVNLTTGATVATVPLESGGEGLSLSANGQKLYVGLVFAGKIVVVDRATRAITSTIVTGGMPREIAADPATQRVLVANQDGWVDVIR